MKFYPILFRPELVQAIRAGHKTQTRRTSHPAQPGDVLVVREAFALGPQREVIYKADHPDATPEGITWKPGIHLPYKHCRLFLRVTHKRREPLQSISFADCLAEGLDPDQFNHSGVARQAFKELWDGINGKTERAWQFDPDVDMLKFEPIPRPVEFYDFLHRRALSPR